MKGEAEWRYRYWFRTGNNDIFGQMDDSFVNLGINHLATFPTAGTSNAGRVDLRPLDGDLFRIERLRPKGAGPFVPRFAGELRACGIMLSSGPQLFSCIEQARTTVKEGEFTDLPVRTQIVRQHGLLGCRLPGTVFDIGNPRGYEHCRLFMAKIVKAGP